jgi:hypothetical protein
MPLRNCLYRQALAIAPERRLELKALWGFWSRRNSSSTILFSYSSQVLASDPSFPGEFFLGASYFGKAAIYAAIESLSVSSRHSAHILALIII